MTPAAKIRFIKNRIEDKISISPKGPVVLPVVDIFTNSFTFSAKDQYLILKKLQEDGYIKGLLPLKANEVWFEMTGKPLDPFGLIAQNKNEITDKSDLISLKLSDNTLTINKQTGMVRLNKVETILNPKSQELDTILKLATAKNYQLTYADILGDSVSKTTKRNLTFVIRNLKQALGILPTNQAKNKDIMKNIKGLGYKLTA